MAVSRSRPENTVLIAITNDRRDFALLQQEGWYRIPVESAPSNVRDGIIKYIAFYHTAAFEEEKFTIRWYAPVEEISIMERSVLFPDESADHPKRGRLYFKIQIGTLVPLIHPIYSQRHRRIIFIPTSEEKFFTTMNLAKPEINYLFNASNLEDLLFQKFIEQRMAPEREYEIRTKNANYRLDFALFCKTRKLGIECDGDKYHTKSDQIFADKRRDNALTSEGWSLLRYPQDQLLHDFQKTWAEITSTITRLGGIQGPTHPYDSYDYRYPPDVTGQGRLWD